MRLTFVVGLAAALAVACISLILHQGARAAHQQLLVSQAETAQAKKPNAGTDGSQPTANPVLTANSTKAPPMANFGSKSYVAGWEGYPTPYNYYQKIIDNRLEQLLNDAEGLGWSSAAKDDSPYAPPATPRMLYPGADGPAAPAASPPVRGR